MFFEHFLLLFIQWVLFVFLWSKCFKLGTDSSCLLILSFRGPERLASWLFSIPFWKVRTWFRTPFVSLSRLHTKCIKGRVNLPLMRFMLLEILQKGPRGSESNLSALYWAWKKVLRRLLFKTIKVFHAGVCSGLQRLHIWLALLNCCRRERTRYLSGLGARLCDVSLVCLRIDSLVSVDDILSGMAKTLLETLRTVAMWWNRVDQMIFPWYLVLSKTKIWITIAIDNMGDIWSLVYLILRYYIENEEKHFYLKRGRKELT